MSQSVLENCRLAGVATCVPSKVVDNVADTPEFPKEDIKKVVSIAGVSRRHVSEGGLCSSDLCVKAAEDLLDQLGWERESVDGLVFVTQTPDYFLPSTSTTVHHRLGLSMECAAFDVGLGCSGYPYGLWMAAMMVNAGHQRVLVLHGETPSLFTHREDRATVLLFGDAGSASAVERKPDAVNPWYFTLRSDGTGYQDLIIHAGGFRDRFGGDQREHYVHMNGSNIFNFTIKRTPPLIKDTLELAGRSADDIDYFVFHQSNRFIMKHLMKKCGLRPEQVPIILDEFGNTGGPSVPLAITKGVCSEERKDLASLMTLGYGVGLSWSAGLVDLDRDAVISHSELAEEEAAA